MNRNELRDLELARAAWRDDLHRVARLFVEERAADRRRGRDEPLRRVRVFRHDQLKDERPARFLDDVDGGPETGAIARNAFDVDQRDLRHALLEHADPRLDEALPLLRRLVLGVLAQVAQLARALDLLRQLELQLVIQRLNLVLELANQAIFHPYSHGVGVMVPQWYP